MRHVERRAGLYRDSVQLMQISARLTALPGVTQALVAMATSLNVELLAGMGFPPADGAGPTDMLVAIDASDGAAMAAALARLDSDLGGGAGQGGLTRGDGVPPGRFGTGEAVLPRTIGAAVRRVTDRSPSATVALVSTPGRHAFVEAMDALHAGASVMVFSDNVPVAQEVELKREAARRGLLVLGPDCGTAVIAGVGLGFANVVRPGPVGLVAASGTGAQQVMSLLAWAGVGISHCLGVGGRDLSAAVGGLSTHAALDALDADPSTQLILVIGKPADASVAATVSEHAARLTTPCLVAPLGPGRPDLTAVTEQVLTRLGVAAPQPWPRWLPDGATGAGPGHLRGLYSGGTLCAEAVAIAAATLGPVWSNVSLDPQWKIGAEAALVRHALVDLGADEYTVGRPHPMIDTGPRLERLATQAADPSCAVVLIDVVLGHAAHPDPATELAPAVRAARAARVDRPISFVVSLVGTPDDPQDVSRQAAVLHEAGAAVFVSNAEAARHAVSLADSTMDGAL